MQVYKWPGCAFSSQIQVMEDGAIAITFSETIDDFLYNLRQTASIDGGVSSVINELIDKIEAEDETTARAIIKAFEENVRLNMNI